MRIATARPAHTEVHNLHTQLGPALALVHVQLELAPWLVQLVSTSQRLDGHIYSVDSCSVDPYSADPCLVDPCAVLEPCPAVREHRPVAVAVADVAADGDARGGEDNYMSEVPLSLVAGLYHMEQN